MSRGQTTRLCVEDCVVLSTVDLRRHGVFTSAFGSPCVQTWNDRTGTTLSCVEYDVVEGRGCAMALRFRYNVIDESLNAIRPVHYLVEVTTTRPTFGGRRFWFWCPVVDFRTRCGRRVGRLYLPPGQQVFGCRHCYNLTYLSAQRHDKRKDRLLRNPAALALALQSETLREQLLGIAACVQAIGRLRKTRRGRQSDLSKPE